MPGGRPQKQNRDNNDFTKKRGVDKTCLNPMSGVWCGVGNVGLVNQCPPVPPWKKREKQEDSNDDGKRKSIKDIRQWPRQCFTGVAGCSIARGTDLWSVPLQYPKKQLAP